MIVPSGSCAGMFREHYALLFKDEPDTLRQVQTLAERTFELAEFLLHVCKVELKDQGAPIKVALHTSCSARREMNTHLHGRALLAQLGNVERVEHDHESECCGFGGTFSVRMPDISGAMVRDKSRALQDSGAAQVISADCGCLMNINGSLELQDSPLRGQHLASFLWQRTGGRP
ncbi:Lactate utilization protein A [compost metagenome]